MTAVECADLLIRYGSVTAVDGLSFSADPGEVLALLGPNGAGKTSTIESLEGYRRPERGRMSILGLDPLTEHSKVVLRMGVMLQRGGVYPMLTPRQVLSLFSCYYPKPDDPEQLLQTVGLDAVATTPWRHLSGGEQQRLSLALALIGRPDVVFLDEPTAGVDPEGRLAIRAVIAELAERAVCVILATHELAEAEKLAQRVVIIHHGRVLAQGTPAQLASDPAVGAPAVRFRAPGQIDISALSSAVGAPVSGEGLEEYRVSAPPSPQLIATVASWLADNGSALTDLRTALSLEETYLSMVGQAGEPDDIDGGTSQDVGGRRRRRSARSRAHQRGSGR